MCVWGGGGSLVVTFSPCALQHFWLAVCLLGEANERVVAVCVCMCVCVCVCVCVSGMSGLRQRVVGAWL